MESQSGPGGTLLPGGGAGLGVGAPMDGSSLTSPLFLWLLPRPRHLLFPSLSLPPPSALGSLLRRHFLQEAASDCRIAVPQSTLDFSLFLAPTDCLSAWVLGFATRARASWGAGTTSRCTHHWPPWVAHARPVVTAQQTCGTPELWERVTAQMDAFWWALCVSGDGV